MSSVPRSRCVSDLADFRALHDEWQDLFSRCPGQTPFNSWHWLFSWWMAYGGARSLRILLVETNGRLCGIAPLYLDTERTAIRATCRVLRMIGDGSFDSDHLDFLVEPGREADMEYALGAWLRSSREWDVLVLRELTSATSLVQTMRDVAASLDSTFQIHSAPSAVLDLPASFDSFLKERQSRFRTRIRSLLRRVDQDELVFESQCKPCELKRKLRSLFALHQQRWEAAGDTGVFKRTAKRRFYAQFATRFARAGWLRFYSLRRGNQYVAHQICFGVAGVTYLLQEGYDVTDPSASFGQTLRASVIRQLIGAGERRYDFLGGFSRHKEEWGARRGETLSIIVARRTIRGWLYANSPVALEKMTNIAKRFLPPVLIEGLRRLRSTLRPKS